MKDSKYENIQGLMRQLNTLIEDAKLQSGALGNTFMNFLLARSPDITERYSETQKIEQTTKTYNIDSKDMTLDQANDILKDIK